MKKCQFSSPFWYGFRHLLCIEFEDNLERRVFQIINLRLWDELPNDNRDGVVTRLRERLTGE